jgi:hypothetical protein
VKSGRGNGNFLNFFTSLPQIAAYFFSMDWSVSTVGEGARFVSIVIF